MPVSLLRPRAAIDGCCVGALLLLTLAWDATGLDLALAHVYGSAQGFALKNHSMLQFWFHSVAQNTARLIFGVCVLMIWFPLGVFKQVPRADRVHCVLATVVASLSVVLLKHVSLSSCPWSLAQFGGVAAYVSHWQWGVADGGGGRCFPGGHASAGFAFLAGSVWLRAASLRKAHTVAGVAIAVGLVLGWVQQMRGAHFLSHTLWAWFVCAAIGAAYYHGVQCWRGRRNA